MENTYTWDCKSVKAYPLKNELENVIFTVHWRLNATDGENHSSVYGSIGINTEDLTNFTPYEDLTHADIISWVESAMGEEEVARLKESLDKQIEEQVNPTQISLTIKEDSAPIVEEPAV